MFNKTMLMMMTYMIMMIMIRRATIIRQNAAKTTVTTTKIISYFKDSRDNDDNDNASDYHIYLHFSLSRETHLSGSFSHFPCAESPCQRGRSFSFSATFCNELCIKTLYQESLPTIVLLTPNFFPTLRLNFILPQPLEFVFNLTFRQLGSIMRAFPKTLCLLMSLLGLCLYLL